MGRVPAALSVDFEFFTHLPAYRGARGTTDATDLGVEGVERLCDAFESAGAAGTWFTVGDIAEDYPSVLGRVADGGHEIASHTHTHQHLSELDAPDRRFELVRSKERLEAATGADVDGFRAPSFDLADDHFAELADAGYEYDSSVVPCRSIPGWYGGEFDTCRPSPATDVDPGAPPGFREVPVAVMPRLRLPLTGTWIRFFGVNYTLAGMYWLARRGVPPVLYVHPWELSDLPAVEGVPRRVYFRTGSYMRRAVERILDADFEFVTVRSLAENATSGASPRRAEVGR
ncbi:MAG: polysaccharide deacetylase family protein [Haloarculaceae archaeon]